MILIQVTQIGVLGCGAKEINQIIASVASFAVFVRVN